MGLIKGITKYIFILLLICLGAGVLLCAIMMLVPSVSIFGYRFVNITNYNKVLSVEYLEANNGYNPNATKIREIEIDAENVDVYLHPKKAYAFTIHTHIMGNGFAKSDKGTNEELFYTEKPQVVEIGSTGYYKLLITNRTAEGLMNLTIHELKVYIPEEFVNLSNVKITTKGGNISIMGDNDASEGEKAPNFNIQQKTTLSSVGGDITIQNARIQDLEASTVSGSMNFTKSIGDINGFAKLSSNYGPINFEEGVDVMGNCKVNSGLSRINLQEIFGTLDYEGESAFFNIKKVNGRMTVITADAIIKIGEIYGEGITDAILIDNPVIGNRSYEIEKANVERINLESNSGYIKIRDLTTNTETTCMTKSGDIKIDKLLGNATVSTTSGNISINQAKYADCVGNEGVLRNSIISVQSEKGTITLSDIVGVLDVKVMNNGISPINLKVLEVNGNSTINSQKGTINAYLPVKLADNTTNNEYSIAFFKKTGENKTISGGNISNENLYYGEINKEKYYHIQMNDPVTGTCQGDNPVAGKPVFTIYSQVGDIILDNFNNPSTAE